MTADWSLQQIDLVIKNQLNPTSSRRVKMKIDEIMKQTRMAQSSDLDSIVKDQSLNPPAILAMRKIFFDSNLSDEIKFFLKIIWLNV